MPRIRRHRSTQVQFLRSPKLFAAIYLVLIPLYAIFYSALDESFYHATAPYEVSVSKAQVSLQEALLEEIKSAATSAYGGRREVGQFVLELETMRFPHLEYAGDSFTLAFKLSGRSSDSSTSPNYTEFFFRVGFQTAPNVAHRVFPPSPKEDRYIREATIEDFRLVGQPSSFETEHHSFDALVLFPRRELVLGSTMNQRVQDLRQAIEGFPSKLGGSFWRMLYLSGITITTVGYGDILPTSDTTRVLVMTEAVVGVVLAGLFLNAVAGSKMRRTGLRA